MVIIVPVIAPPIFCCKDSENSLTFCKLLKPSNVQLNAQVELRKKSVQSTWHDFLPQGIIRGASRRYHQGEHIMIFQPAKTTVALAVALLLYGCASATKIESTPQGATLYINGEKTGVTPMSLS
jgi:hypothetical protein